MTNFKKLRQMIEVKGDGNIVSKEIPVSSFLRLHISGKGLIELIQANEEKVVIETDENLLNYFEAQNSGSTLYVTTEAKLRRPVFTKCVLKVYLRQLDKLVIRCEGGDVVCPGPIKVSMPIDVKIQSLGNTSLDIDAPALKLLSQCVGDVRLMGTCGDVTIKNQSEGNFSSDMDTLSMKMLSQSVGNVMLSGKCGSIAIKNQSEGDFSSRELKAEDLAIKNMAAGNIEVYADKTISISHYGEGYVHYYGDAVLKKVKQYGDGEIKHIG